MISVKLMLTRADKVKKRAMPVLLGLVFLCFSFSSKNEIQNKDCIKKESLGQQRKIEYYTNNIFNNEYIVADKKWPFDIDPKGEDVLGEYGRPFNEIIDAKEVKGKVTLANKKMTIRSNVFNSSKEQFFIDNILLSIVEKIDFEEVEVGKGFWETRDFENTCSFELTKGKNEYEYADVHIDLAANGYAFFKFDISTNPSLEGKIIKYKIKLSLNNGRGKRQVVNSDKLYVIGCY